MQAPPKILLLIIRDEIGLVERLEIVVPFRAAAGEVRLAISDARLAICA